MLSKMIISLCLMLLSQFTYSQIMESHVDYTISPGSLLDGKIHYAQEWLGPNDFNNKEMRVIDFLGVSKTHPDNVQLVAAKVAFTSKKSFDELSLVQINNAEFISEMLESVSIRPLDLNNWRVTNKVKAYGLLFRVSFNLNLQERSENSLGLASRYLKAEASGLKSLGRERYIILDMSEFSLLMYRNYAVIYMRELAKKKTLIVSGIVAAIDINRAQKLFPFGPKKTMMNNLQTQVMNMVKNLQKAK